MRTLAPLGEAARAVLSATELLEQGHVVLMDHEELPGPSHLAGHEIEVLVVDGCCSGGFTF